MNILQICPQIPYPLSDGGKVGIFNITKHLALRGHRITMVTFRRDRDDIDLSILEKYCSLLTVNHSTNNSLSRAFLNLFSSDPYNISKYFSHQLKVLLVDLLRENKYDVVHVDHLHMALYGVICKQIAKIPIVLREHNIESVIIERFAANAKSFWFHTYLEMQLKRIKKTEANQSLQFDCCCVISEDDRRRLHNLQPKAATKVIAAGVDETFFRTPSGRSKIPYSICFFGSLDWISNRDAVLWFIRSILPIIVSKEPRTRFYVIGKSVPKEIEQLQDEFIVLRGFVSDLPKEIEQYEISIAPMRIGSGIRLKILESFSMRIPVVSTRVGYEGIPARHQEHLLVADNPEEFSDQVLSLFKNPSLSDILTKNAFDLAERQFRWDYIAHQFEQLYTDLIEKAKLSL